ncbi:MAG: hypothetical protein OEY34_07610 [Cyclobacteriaceae bacterium]|nr:hypothetical protein [Cyclobacteriaceae bacterium]
MEGLKVGRKVFVLKIGNMARDSQSIDDRIVEAKITKVGRKYFETSYTNARFYNDSMVQDSGEYIANMCVYFSREEILKEIEIAEKAEKIRKYFSGYGNDNIWKSDHSFVENIYNEIQKKKGKI